MAAYAALLSLVRSLHQILDLEKHIDPRHKERIISLVEKVDSIVTLLEDCSEKHRGTLDRVGNETRNAAYEAQDFMDSYLCSVSTTHDDGSSSEADCDHEVSLDRDLDMAFERIDFIWDETTKMKNGHTAKDLRSRTFSSPVDHSSTVEVTVNKVVEFDDDLNAIKERMYEDSSKLQIIPIVGMGGIGKTTLARRTYEDSLRAQYFDILAWTTVSGEYQRRGTLLELLQSFKKHTTERSGESEAQLAKLLYQNLIGRRYLIVIDDIWSTKAWDDLKMIFPDDDNGSRILLTTRLSDVAGYAGSSNTPIHQMKFLDEDQSWKLLQEKIFGQESCPIHLVELGKQVARNCRGLPLTIVVVAGLLLSSGNTMEEELWESILENISSIEPTIQEQCSEILSLSYDWLPLRLKPCFLYMAAFPEDFEIDVSKLIMLWVAEGFLKPSNQSKCLEDVGKGCLEDLVNRNLILVRKKGPDGELVVVGIHDLLRKICITKAEEEGFLHQVSSTRNVCNDAIENPKRRLGAHSARTLEALQTQDSSVRSIFSEIGVEHWYYPELSLKSRRLSILNSPNVTWWYLSRVISTLVNLRYISFAVDDTISSDLDMLLASLSKIPNLEAIIADVDCYQEFQVPYEILRMPKLRHLIINQPFYFSDPPNIGLINKSDLQTLGIVINFIFTEDVIKILVNLKKLTVVFEGFDYNRDDCSLNNLFRLQNLEELEVAVGLHNYVQSAYDLCRPYLIWNYDFPISLKKLTLRGVLFAWENMTIIGSLPDLQVLEIVENEIETESEWTLIEGQFLRLKYFRSSLDYLVKWEVEKEHLPSLESLILKNVWLIHEIPCGLGEIDSLQLIELVNCNESLVNSAKQIQEQQRDNGNDAFQVTAINHYRKNFDRSI